MPVLFAFLHHLAAFSLVAALAVEWALLRGPLTEERARQLLRTDLVLGVAAGLILMVGVARAALFEKGAAYYLHNAPFLAKMALFLAVGTASSRPTRVFLNWRKPLAEGRLPTVATATGAPAHRGEAGTGAGAVLILLCATLMARGVGSF